MEKLAQNNIKIKVIAGYILVFLAIITSGYIAYRSYNKLLDSVYSLSSPDDTIIRMNRILTNLSEAENNIRIYSLTQQENHFNNYVVRVDEIQSDLDSLKTLNFDNNLQKALIDSMNYLLEERSEKLNFFVNLKQTKFKDNANFYRQAIEKLKVTSNTFFTKVEYTKTAVSTLDTVKTAVPVKKRKKGVFGWLSKKEEVIDTQKVVIQSTEIKIDTSYIPHTDSLLMTIENILRDAHREEMYNREILSREELQLINENSLILVKIKKILKQLEQERLNQTTIKVKNAREIANKSIITISIIITIGFIFCALFIFFILTDVTRSNYYRKELIAAKERAERLAKVKEDFLSTMSHEIRTPLNTVIGFTEQMDKTFLQNKQKTFLNAIKNSSSHLLGLINEILDFSKIEAEKLIFEKLPFNPHELINDVSDVLNLSAQKKGLESNSTFVNKQDILYEGDSFRLKQILLNLIGNATKFTEKGKIEIKAEIIDKNGFCIFRIDVIDTGIGIEKEKLETIFSDFTQSDSFSARKYGGVGLGLAISRRLARLMEGDLTVESVVGKGSKFTVEIPLNKANDTSQEKQTESSIDVPAWLSKKRFLVADDDDYNLLLLNTIFSRWNLSADFVKNGKLAWSKIIKNDYDLILTDIHMPKLSGLDICSQLRNLNDKKKSSTPVVALTANIREADLKKYIDTGMAKCLIKPFDEKTLLHTLTEALSKVDEAVTTKNDTPNSMPYDLEEIKKFTENNPDLINKVLETFITNAKKDVKKLQKALQNKNLDQIGEIAHKMLTSFNQLKIRSVVPFLTELEGLLYKKNFDDVDYKQIEILINNIQKNSTKVIDDLEILLVK